MVIAFHQLANLKYSALHWAMNVETGVFQVVATSQPLLAIITVPWLLQLAYLTKNFQLKKLCHFIAKNKKDCKVI